MQVISYLDTSFLFKAYVTERGSPSVISHIQNPDNTLLINLLTDVEITATLARRLGKTEAQRALAVYLDDRHLGVYSEVRLSAGVWSLAQNLIFRCGGPPFLRSLDALHLATALGGGATQFATFDHRLAKAAALLGLSVPGTPL